MWGVGNMEQRPKGHIEPPMLPVYREGCTRPHTGPEVGWRVDGRGRGGLEAEEGKGGRWIPQADLSPWQGGSFSLWMPHRQHFPVSASGTPLE